jgi:hypothetical protein
MTETAGGSPAPEHDGERPHLNDGNKPSWELMGDEVLVLDHQERTLHRFHGSAACVARRLLAGDTQGWDADDELQLAVARTLIETGVLDPTALDGLPPRGIDRRALLVAGAAFGVTALVLPTAAAAASGEGAGFAGGGGSGGVTTTTIATTTTTTTVAPDDPPGSFLAQATTPGNTTMQVYGTDS